MPTVCFVSGSRDSRTGETGIEIRPATVDDLSTLLDDPAAFEATTGRRVEPGWSCFEGVLEFSLKAITTDGVAPEWSTYLFFDLADGALIGIGGFKGPPDRGVVEIGYEIAPSRRGRGQATAAARAMVERASAAGCTQVVAHTLAEPNPSTSVLTKLGFVQTVEILDPDDGPIWRWELALDA